MIGVGEGGVGGWRRCGLGWGGVAADSVPVGGGGDGVERGGGRFDGGIGGRKTIDVSSSWFLPKLLRIAGAGVRSFYRVFNKAESDSGHRGAQRPRPLFSKRERSRDGTDGFVLMPVATGIESSKGAILLADRWAMRDEPEAGWARRIAAKPLRSEPGRSGVGADLEVGSSKYSMGTLKGERGDRFHVNGTCTWPAHPGKRSVGGRVQRWKRTARSRLVSGLAPQAALGKSGGHGASPPGRTHNRIRLKEGWVYGRGVPVSKPARLVGGLLELLTRLCERGPRVRPGGRDWERSCRGAFPGDETQPIRTGERTRGNLNRLIKQKPIAMSLRMLACDFCPGGLEGAKRRKFNQGAGLPLSLSTNQRNHSHGNGLGRYPAGKEDPVELALVDFGEMT
ncbi:hypothetical protein Tco_0065247 [Tanacetum coccineum]